MKVLITGANGFLGQHLTLFLSKSGYEVFASGRGDCRIAGGGFSYAEINLLSENSVYDKVKQISPDVIIHAAAMSKPDECEKNKELCIATNVDSTKHLLKASKFPDKSPFFIYVSTDFVFGEGGPHSEDDTPAPLNFYGESKLMAEEKVWQSQLDWCIMRPVFIYGEALPGIRPSFLHWVKNNIELGKQIKVVSDQLRTPTYVEDICKGLDAIIQKRATGIYHLAGKDILSPYEMAIKVAELSGLDTLLIENVTEDTFKEPVKRAKHSGLKIEKTIKELNYDPLSFEEGIKATFKANNL